PIEPPAFKSEVVIVLAVRRLVAQAWSAMTARIEGEDDVVTNGEMFDGSANLFHHAGAFMA
ncbi:hypothetical protein LTS09_018299, partial [Friedmanniomyces endolithicus]